MKEKQFQSCLSLYGADLNLWPDAIRKEAREALSASPQLQSLLEKESQFEERLRVRKTEEPSSQMMENILKAAARTPQNLNRPTPIRDWFLGVWGLKPLFALSLILIIGFTIGYLSNPKKEIATPATDLASLLYHDEDVLWGLNSK